MAYIITKSKTKSSGRGATANAHAGAWSSEAQTEYKKSKYKAEFRQEKRVQELANQGFNEAAISGMMCDSESSVKTLMRNRKKGHIPLDGKY